jgi:hypothetical protein
MTEGVDYSYGRPGAAALVAAGKRFAMRYVPYSGDNGKGLGRAELADLLGHNIAVGLVLERGKASALLGRKAGVADANTAEDAVRSLGFPKDQPVYFAVDFDATKSQQAAIDAYLGGAASVLGVSRVGVYGSIDVVERCAENSSARWFWQTYAWSGGALSAKAHVYQYHNGQSINGAAVDFCRSLAADFGAWMPLPDSSTENTDMAISTSGLTLTSDYEIVLPAGSDVLDAPGGKKLGDFAGPHDYFGSADGYKAVRVDPPNSSSVIGYTASAASPVKKPVITPDCKAAVNAALDHVLAPLGAVATAITEARPR